MYIIHVKSHLKYMKCIINVLILFIFLIIIIIIMIMIMIMMVFYSMSEVVINKLMGRIIMLRYMGRKSKSFLCL